jgi:hypothetical protein
VEGRYLRSSRKAARLGSTPSLIKRPLNLGGQTARLRLLLLLKSFLSFYKQVFIHFIVVLYICRLCLLTMFYKQFIIWIVVLAPPSLAAPGSGKARVHGPRCFSQRP